MTSTVGRCWRKSGSSSWPSKVRGTITRAPAARAMREKQNPPICDSEEPGRMTSSAVISQPRMIAASTHPRVSMLWVTPLAGPLLCGTFSSRSGRLSSAAVRPAFRFHSRSRFHVRSPILTKSSSV